jgi:DNA primase
MDYWIQRVLARADLKRPEGKVKALGEIVPRIRRLPDRVAWDHYAGVLAERLRISEGRIHEMLQQGGSRGPTVRPPAETAEDPFRVERLLLQAVLREPPLASRLGEDVLADFQEGPYRALAAIIVRWAQKGSAQGYGVLETAMQEPEMASLLSSLLAHLEEVGEDPGAVCDGCVKHLRRKGMERQIQAVGEAIARARERRAEEDLRGLEDRMRDLIQRKARLRMSV